MVKDNKEKEIETTTDSDIIDIEIKESPKKKFRVNGDNSKILELNTSDLNIMSRLQIGYERLQKLMQEFTSTPNDDNVLESFAKIDKAMREQLDFIFDSNVSELCGSGGSMYDPYNGMFRYEHILDTLTKLYANNLNDEYKKIKKRLSKHTDKYTKGK